MDLVDRLYFQLRQTVARERPDPDGAFTIADVYQRLIPYRAVRAEQGIQELAQYEHALLRLLAGERDYLQVEDVGARLELQRELASPNPILGVYRDYGGVGLRLAGSSDRRTREAEPPAPEPPPAPQPAAAPVGPTVCAACAGPLPEVPGVSFCPACGADQREVPCGGCGSAVRPGWRFCVKCGRPRSAA